MVHVLPSYLCHNKVENRIQPQTTLRASNDKYNAIGALSVENFLHMSRHVRSAKWLE